MNLRQSLCLFFLLLTVGCMNPMLTRVQGPPALSESWDPERYIAYRTDAALVIDGVLDEAAWAQAPWTHEFVDIEGSARPAPRFKTQAKMLWDDEFFYVTATLEEPHVWATFTNRDSIIYYDNDFEVFIDPDGDSQSYYELEINAFGTEWDLFLVKTYIDGGPAIHAWDIPGLKSAVSIDGTINQPDEDRGWSVEIAFPWAALKEAANRPSPPNPGDQWRVNFSRVQWRTVVEDGTYVRLTEPLPGRPVAEDNWVWSAQHVINMHLPEMWGIVQFSSLVAGEGTEAVEQRPEDLAKWALRRLHGRQGDHLKKHQHFAGRMEELGLDPTEFPIVLEADGDRYEASIIVNEKNLKIREDGRVW